MNRRSIFKLFAGAVAASAMEVCGWTMPTSRVEAPSYIEPWVWRNEYSDAAANHEKYYAALMKAYQPERPLPRFGIIANRYSEFDPSGNVIRSSPSFKPMT